MTQKDLSQKLHVTAGTISNYENGVHLPDVDKLINLADIFHVTTDYLLGRCTSRLSPDVLDRKLLAGKTAGHVIHEVAKMTPERKQALAVILDDMCFRALLDQYGESAQ